MNPRWRASYSLNQSGFSLIEAMVGLIVIAVMGLALSTLLIGANRQTKQNALKVDSISLANEVTALLSDPAVCKVNFAGKSFASIPEASLTQLVNQDGVPFYKVFNPAAKEYSGISKFKILGMSIDQTKGGADATNKTTTLVMRIATERLSSSETLDDSQRQLVQMIRLSYTDAGPSIVSCRSVGGITDLWTRKLTDGAYNDVFYSGGKVGIGTNSPNWLFHVQNDLAGANVRAAVQNGATGAGTSADLIAATGTTDAFAGFLQFDGSSPYMQIISGPANTGGMFIDQQGTGPLVFRTAGAVERARLTSTGNFGIGTNDPKAALEVNGGVKIGNEGVCDATKEGTVRYQVAVKNIQICDGTKWVTMVDPATMCAKLGGTWDAPTEKCTGAFEEGASCNVMKDGLFPLGSSPDKISCSKTLSPKIAVADISEADRTKYLWKCTGFYGGPFSAPGPPLPYNPIQVTTYNDCHAVAHYTNLVATGGVTPSGYHCRRSEPPILPSPGAQVYTCGGKCVKGVIIPDYCYSGPGASADAGTCFTHESLVLMGDGSRKKIADVKIGDWVLSEKGSLNRVTGIDHTRLGNRKLISLNGSDFFATDDHPMGVATGWAAFNPHRVKTKLGSPVEKLLPGQILKTSQGPEVLMSLDLKPDHPQLPLIQLHLDGDHTYYVNDFLVHNCGDGGGGDDGDGDGGI